MPESASSRARLLAAGKELFARFGYERTSTAAIARLAGSSESQLIRNFGGKVGLLEAIFDESWARINERTAAQVSEAEHARDAIARLLGVMVEEFTRDPEIAFLLLFEGRRTRNGPQEMMVSRGFARFLMTLDAQIADGIADGSFTDVDPRLVRAAVIGSAEGLMRERLMTQYDPQGAISAAEIDRTFRRMLGGLAGPAGQRG